MAESKLKIDIRRDKILAQLRREGRVSVAQLSEELGATTVTIRNDLTALEQDGHLLRVKGGAVPLPAGAAETGVHAQPDSRMLLHAPEKQAIAAGAARLVQDGDTLFINSGTTTQYVALALKEHRSLNIVTNSLMAATELGTVPSFRVLLLGGDINAQYGFTSGDDAQEQLRRYQADWAVLSIDGISTEGGLTTYHAEEATVNRLMIERSKQTLIVADHTKIGKAGFSRVCAIGGSFHLMTNRQADSAALASLRESGLRVTCA